MHRGRFRPRGSLGTVREPPLPAAEVLGAPPPATSAAPAAPCPAEPVPLAAAAALAVRPEARRGTPEPGPRPWASRSGAQTRSVAPPARLAPMCPRRRRSRWRRWRRRPPPTPEARRLLYKQRRLADPFGQDAPGLVGAVALEGPVCRVRQGLDAHLPRNARDEVPIPAVVVETADLPRMGGARPSSWAARRTRRALRRA